MCFGIGFASINGDRASDSPVVDRAMNMVTRHEHDIAHLELRAEAVQLPSLSVYLATLPVREGGPHGLFDLVKGLGIFYLFAVVQAR